MNSHGPNQFNIFEIYRKYCDIKCIKGCRRDGESLNGKFSREALNSLLELVESRLHLRVSIFDEISKLMSRLDLKADFSEFSRFYDFVFFICRENGQKNITVSRAVSCWRLVLAGRFRLLKQWCNFVEKNHRHNISEDTWKQVLVFSRCVHENLEGYDPKGAWPVLIDDFVEHMYRTTGYGNNPSLSCSCGDTEARGFKNPLPGLKMFPGFKRKMGNDVEMREVESLDISAGPTLLLPCKRRPVVVNGQFVWEWNPLGNSTSNDSQDIAEPEDALSGCSKSPCAVDGCLSKGFAGLFTARSRLQVDEKKIV